MARRDTLWNRETNGLQTIVFAMDTLSRRARSRVMSRIRGVNTRLEGELECLLLQNGVKDYLRSPKEILGKPDFVFDRERLAVFVDSCFWHGCRRHLRMPKSNTHYWKKKIETNRLRDQCQRRKLVRIGWRVLRVWEHELRHPERALRRIKSALKGQPRQ